VHHKPPAAVVELQEHLVLVCELLRANLFEFQRFTRASGEPPYFTLPRVQSIARQVGRLSVWDQYYLLLLYL
jgi:hypothetical protein